MKPLYTAVVTATGGRNGRVRSSDTSLDLHLAMPEGLGGAGDIASNPEQLFAAGYAACFESALRLVGVMQGVPVDGASVTARVSIGEEDGTYDLGVELHARLPGIKHEQARGLMESAHQVCPYSRATRGNIEVKLVVDP